jgi:hypothetical protein
MIWSGVTRRHSPTWCKTTLWYKSVFWGKYRPGFPDRKVIRWLPNTSLLQQTMWRPRKSYSSLPTILSYKVCCVLSRSTASSLHMAHHPFLFAFTYEVYEQIMRTGHCLHFTKYVYLNQPTTFYILKLEPKAVLMNVLSKTITTIQITL